MKSLSGARCQLLNQRKAHSRVAHLQISDTKLGNSDSSTVEVNIGHSRGIISSSGSHFPRNLQFKFSISMKSTYKEQTEKSVLRSLLCGMMIIKRVIAGGLMTN